MGILMQRLTRYLTLLGAAYIAASCLTHDVQTGHGNGIDQLREKYKTYLLLAEESADVDGWIDTDECDATLHTGMFIYAGGEADIGQAQDEDGRIWRRPARDCLETGKSKSSTSRDMVLGAMLAFWKRRDLKGIELAIRYLEKNGNLGEHDGSIEGKNRVTATPTFRALMYELRDRLGGPYSAYQEVPQAYFPNKGYQAHLQALNILLWGDMTGSISKVQLNTITAQAEADPNNALFWAIRNRSVNGDQSRAIAILLREDLFPPDRLPTTADRCIGYLWMHGEKPKDWDPCPEKKAVHHGHDFLLAAAVILGN